MLPLRLRCSSLAQHVVLWGSGGTFWGRSLVKAVRSWGQVLQGDIGVLASFSSSLCFLAILRTSFALVCSSTIICFLNIALQMMKEAIIYWYLWSYKSKTNLSFFSVDFCQVLENRVIHVGKWPHFVYCSLWVGLRIYWFSISSEDDTLLYQEIACSSYKCTDYIRPRTLPRKSKIGLHIPFLNAKKGKSI